MLKVMKKKLLVVITMLVVASGFIFTGSTSTKAEDNEVQYLGKYKLTAYCGRSKERRKVRVALQWKNRRIYLSV